MKTTQEASQCPNRGPGRYEGEPFPCITAALEEQAMHGFSDDEVGSCTEGNGHATLFRGPLEPMPESPLCAKCAKGLDPKSAGQILFTDTVGFRSAYLAGVATEELETAWADYVKDLELEGGF